MVNVFNNNNNNDNNCCYINLPLILDYQKCFVLILKIYIYIYISSFASKLFPGDVFETLVILSAILLAIKSLVDSAVS